MTSEKKRPTIFDVAERAKVSITTVSRVINKVPTVTDSNRLRVEKAIKELGFVPDVSAQRLAGGKKLSIGFVLPYYEDMFHTFYSMELLRGVNQGIIENNLDIVSLHFSTGNENSDSDILNPSYVSAILFADYHKNENLIAKAKELGLPYLIINYYKKDTDENCIGIDNKQAAVDAVKYLISLGHRKIATITGDPVVQSGYERLAGYKEALYAKGISIEDDYIVNGNWSGESGAKGMRKLLALKERPTAVFIAGDEMAMQAEEVAIKSGLRIPNDLAIMGFDDVPLAALSRVPLTTMRQPLFELGRQGVTCLTQIVTGKIETPVKKLLSAELVVRESCTPKAKKS